MSKSTIIVLFLVSSNFLYSQKLQFNFEGIQIEFTYNIAEGDLHETITLINLSESSIFVPVLGDTSLYYFFRKKTAYSYFGICTSRLGVPNLGGRVFLERVEAGDSMKIDLIIPYSNQAIEAFHINIDFLTEEGFRKTTPMHSFPNRIPMREYIELCKSVYFRKTLSE